jgi:hypothetical protein
MALTQLERLAKMEQKVDDVCVKVSDIDVKLDKLISAMDEKYAPKYLERVFWTSFGTLFAAGVGILAYIVNNHFKF